MNTLVSYNRIVNATVARLADRARFFDGVKPPEEALMEITRFLNVQELQGKIYPLVVKKIRDHQDKFMLSEASFPIGDILVRCKLYKNQPTDKFAYLLLASFSNSREKFESFCNCRSIPMCKEMLETVNLHRELQIIILASASSEWWLNATEEMKNGAIYLSNNDATFGVYNRRKNIIYIIDPSQSEYRRKLWFNP